MMVSSVSCPHKYFTLEEQCQAHAKSSARSYERYKTGVNQERHYQYWSQTWKQSKPSLSVQGEKMSKMSEGPSYVFFGLLPLDITESFMASVTTEQPQGDDSNICSEITKISKLIDAVDKHEARILNIVGMGPELAEAHKYWDCMEEVQQWLKDILCGIMEGINVLVQSYTSCQLLYQHVNPSISP
ncbi:hypothetical protein EDD18DRAFT_1116098 [Armillaria luteobubalina]|uniref:Uncharacterized protein n=1 Tax=Armillaria luteobubalina TaxID=153913 RepID=A0AA39P126_9AGAR|nr:hypothetical protein EDD18DRAFT_1116098 [Armillaria luteobubalina]